MEPTDGAGVFLSSLHSQALDVMLIYSPKNPDVAAGCPQGSCDLFEPRNFNQFMFTYLRLSVYELY